MAEDERTRGNWAMVEQSKSPKVGCLLCTIAEQPDNVLRRGVEKLRCVRRDPAATYDFDSLSTASFPNGDWGRSGNAALPIMAPCADGQTGALLCLAANTGISSAVTRGARLSASERVDSNRKPAASTLFKSARSPVSASDIRSSDLTVASLLSPGMLPGTLIVSVPDDGALGNLTIPDRIASAL